MLNHPFFNGIDLDKLFQKKIKAPFLPQISDPELMRQSSEQVVLLKNLRESVPSQEVNQDLFSDFGTDIDKTAEQQLQEKKRLSDEMHQRSIQRSLDDPLEETKPLPNEQVLGSSSKERADEERRQQQRKRKK